MTTLYISLSLLVIRILCYKLSDALMFKQILKPNTQEKVWRSERRIGSLIVRVKGLSISKLILLSRIEILQNIN